MVDVLEATSLLAPECILCAGMGTILWELKSFCVKITGSGIVPHPLALKLTVSKSCNLNYFIHPIIPVLEVVYLHDVQNSYI